MEKYDICDKTKLKQCSRCKRWLPIYNFYKNKLSSDGLSSWCKECFKEWQLEDRRRNPSKYRQKRKVQYILNKDKENSSSRNYYRTHIQEISRQRKEYYRTPEGLISRIFADECGNASKRGMSKPEYSLKELTEWAFNQKKFWRLYDEWKKHNYNKDYKPSIDRIDCKKGYSFDNIHLVTWKENLYKSSIEQHFKSKSVCQIRDGKIVSSFPSASFAAKKLGLDYKVIWACCNGYKNSYKGYQWKYVE